MTFASKKEADSHDKMLDMAETFAGWLAQSTLELDEAQCEAVGLHLAAEKEAIQYIIRTSKLPEIIVRQNTDSDNLLSRQKRTPIKAVDAA